jgi:hypothetical protein
MPRARSSRPATITFFRFELCSTDAERQAWSRGHAAGMEGGAFEVPPPRTHDPAGQRLLPGAAAVGVKLRRKPRGGTFAKCWRAGFIEGFVRRCATRGEPLPVERASWRELVRSAGAVLPEPRPTQGATA